MEKYYRIATLTNYPSLPDEKWESDFRRMYPCLHRPSRKAMDVPISVLGQDVALNFVEVCLINYAREDLLEIFGIPLEEQFLTFGKLLDSNGNTISNFRTIGTIGDKFTLRIRGGPKSTRQFCAHCGRFLYYPMWKWYILKSNLTGQPIYYDAGCLIINEELCQRLKQKRWKKLDIYELPILEKPRDGLPADLNTVKPEDLESSQSTIVPAHQRYLPR